MLLTCCCALAGLQQLADLTGSFILSMALWQGQLSVLQACQLTRLEAQYQVINTSNALWVMYDHSD